MKLNTEEKPVKLEKDSKWKSKTVRMQLVVQRFVWLVHTQANLCLGEEGTQQSKTMNVYDLKSKNTNHIVYDSPPLARRSSDQAGGKWECFFIVSSQEKRREVLEFKWVERLSRILSMGMNWILLKTHLFQDWKTLCWLISFCKSYGLGHRVFQKAFCFFSLF